MRYYPAPDDDYDQKYLKQLKAAPWMVELLKLNPGYCSWGNYEDYMSGKSDGWNGPLEFDTLAESGFAELDDYNEVVNFYFELNREGRNCPHCEGSGLNPETHYLDRTWYRHLCPPGVRQWSDQLTQVEVDALWDAGRLHGFKEKPTPEELNVAYQSGMGHDSINRCICVEARAKAQGVYGHCEHCEGTGTEYLEPEAHLSLQLWVLHPRKGAARGVFIKQVTQEDLPQVMAMLKSAAERNAERFSRIVAAAS